ncbi:hypothetical protein AABC73_26520 [Pseudomonas sp. G.S.17]|uniref:hypothetical protein n=1 Tax=Pseudomonas sp. G.S.17 TaxID=3137451 RepID=UPI00311CAC79
MSTLEEIAANLMALELRADQTQAKLFALDDAGWEELMPRSRAEAPDYFPAQTFAPDLLVQMPPRSKITVLRLIKGGLS